MLCPLRRKFKGQVWRFAAREDFWGSLRNVILLTLNDMLTSGIINPMTAMAPGLVRREPGWIYKPSWDLPVLIGSAVLVPMPFLIAWLAQISGWMKPQQAIDL